MEKDFDLLVIGSGPGGLAGAKRAAKFGIKVGIIEQQHIGGVCVNQGCISKKLMVYGSDFARLISDAKDYGWQIGNSSFDWQQFMSVRDQEVERLRQVHKKSLAEAGIEVIQGRVAFLDSHSIQLGNQKLTAEKILIAVGGKPIQPDIPGIEYTITSREIFNLPQLPQCIAIIGGGYIGTEFASILRSFGIEIILIDQSDCILSGFDDDLRHFVRDGLVKRGIRSLCNTTVAEIKQQANSLHLKLNGECDETVVADTILCAIGRTPQLSDLGLDKAGVELNGKAIAVDEYSRTSQPNIYAIGDCTDRLPLTPAARAEGHAFANTVFGDCPQTLDYTYVPSAVFCRPEAATVGLTEAEARQKYGAGNVQCYRSEFQSLYSRLTQCPEKAMLKLVVDRPNDRILGVHLVGENAAEIIQGIALPIKQGITRHDLSNMVGIHPTSAEELFSNF